MKLSLIIPSFYPAVIYGGPIFSTLHTCEELAKIEDVEVFVSTTNTNMHSKLDVPTKQWQTFAPYFYVKYYDETKVDKFSLSLFLNLWKDIKNSDIVHTQAIFNTPIPLSLLLAKLFRKPVVLSPRGSFGGWCMANGSRFKTIWLNLFIKPFSNTIVWHATAEQEKNDILALFPKAQTCVIPNGIEYDRYQHSNLYTKEMYTKKFTDLTLKVDKIIVSMGRLQKKKGFDILIDAFALVLEHYPDAKLFIAGADEGEEQNLRSQIERLGLIQKAFLVGAISGQDKIDFLANADLFALPSHNENFGNVYLEALASGTPIVASLDTPWSEVQDAGCGLWVANTVKDTARAIVDLLSLDREETRLSSKKFASRYGWNTIANSFHALYQKMIQP